MFTPLALKGLLKQDFFLLCKRVKYVMPFGTCNSFSSGLTFSYTPSNNGNNQTIFHSSSPAWHMQGHYADSSCNGMNMEFRALPQKVIYAVKLHNGCLHSICASYFRSHRTPLNRSTEVICISLSVAVEQVIIFYCLLTHDKQISASFD
jgi:hypothetical protein